MSDASIQYRPADFERAHVQHADQLPQIADKLRESDAIGVDLEMVQRVRRRPGGLQEWVQVLALVQLASDRLSVVVDPVRCHDLSPLRALMAGETRKVFLGGGQDAALLEDTGIPARQVVDVGEVALAIFGRREDGMAALTRRIFGLSLDKTVRRTDWLARPLNPVLLSYAHRDAELTLLIYRWFQRNYPEVVAFHERTELDPPLPAEAAPWMRETGTRSGDDPLAVVMELGLDPDRDQQQMADDLRQALWQSRAPRQINRLLRLAADLSLRPLAPDVASFLDSPSSMVRASAARAVGHLAAPDVGEALVAPLRADPIEDVRKAAEAGLRELRMPTREAPPEEDESGAATSLDESALSALQELRRALEGEAG